MPLVRDVVRDRRVETGVPDQSARNLVVAHVIDRRSGQDNVRPRAANELRHATTAVVVMHDAQIAEFQAEICRADHFGRAPGLAAADFRDLFGPKFRAAAVTGSHRRHDDLAAPLFQPQQGAGALNFDVIRMGVDCEDAFRGIVRCRRHAAEYLVEGRLSEPVTFAAQDQLRLRFENAKPERG